MEDKSWRDRVRRLRFYPCALDLIRNSHVTPVTVKNPNRFRRNCTRFSGVTKSGEIFVVQNKRRRKQDEKYFISIYPRD